MQRSLVALVLAAIVLVVYAPILLGGQTWDDARYHTEVAPPRIAAADAVLHGELPTWWEGSALGVPLLAEPSHGAAYPLTWIAATPHTFDIAAIVHVLWCALGVAVWARRRGASDLGALVGGALLATSGVMAGAALRGVLPAVAHLPWLAVTASALAAAGERRARTRYAIASAVFVALIGLAGQPFALAYAVDIVAINVRAPRWQLACVLPGLAIACLLWLPAIAIAGDIVGASRAPVPLARVVELVIPLRGATLYVGVPLVVLAVLGRPSLRAAIAMPVLLVLAFALGPAELHVATFAILATAYAAAGFDRVVQRVPRKLIVVIIALAPSVVALPLAFRTVDRSLVAERPAWASAALRVDVWPRRMFRPVTTFGKTKAEVDATLANQIDTLAGTSAAKWGIGAARSDDPARSILYDRVWSAASAMGGSLLDRYSIGFAMLPSSNVGDSGGAAFHELHRRGEWALVEYPGSPALALVYEWQFAPTADTALARLFPPGGKRGLDAGIVVLQGQGNANQDEPGPPQACELRRWDAGAIDARCTADRPAYHVVSSTAARGWSVTVDGRETPWLVADVVRRAIALPAGEHQIAWRYWPPGLTAALVLAALGTMGLLALWLVYGRSSDARDRTPDPERTRAN